MFSLEPKREVTHIHDITLKSKQSFYSAIKSKVYYIEWILNDLIHSYSL
jgi:hypothetical protein